MPRNLLLPPAPRDPRCTGRTTAIALDLLARALKNQGHVCYATDHHAPGTPAAANNLYHAVSLAIKALDLKHIELRSHMTGGQYNGHVSVVSKIWEE